MASAVSSEEPQPPPEVPSPPATPNPDLQGESEALDPSKGVVPEPSPENVDQVENDTSRKMVPDSESEKTQGEVNDQKDPIQRLQDRVNGLEQRLQQAGLLEKLEDHNESQSPEQGSVSSKASEVEERSDGPEVTIQTLGNRIDSLEKRLEESERLSYKPKKGKPELPAIPQLHYVEWSGFKNKLAGEEKFYAIEVLVGGARYFYQRSEEERKSKQRWKDRNYSGDQPANEHKKSKLMPERIRINSLPIILILNQIDPTDRSEFPVVMLRPFKALIYHEARIREVYDRLTKKWGSADTDPSSSQAFEPPETKDMGDNPASANPDAINDPTLEGSEAQTKAENKLNPIPLSPTAVEVHSTTPILNDSVEQSGIPEAENGPPSEDVPKVESQKSRDEETEDLTDSLEALRDLRCLIEFIDVEIKPVADSYRDGLRQKISFCDLWHLFKPGNLVYCPPGHKGTSDFIYGASGKAPRKPEDRFQEVWRITSTCSGRPHLKHYEGDMEHAGYKTRINPFLFYAYWIDFSATRFGARTFEFTIMPFSGEQDINSLQCYPLSYVPKVDQLKPKWTARGEAFREYATSKYTHRYYVGKTLTCAPDGVHMLQEGYPKHSEYIDSQVVVDFGEALAARPGWRTKVYGLYCDPSNLPGEFSEDYPTVFWKDSRRHVWVSEREDEIYEDEHIDIKLMEDYIRCDSLLRDPPQTGSASNGDLDENHMILLPNRVFAFVMKNRKWANLTVDGLRPIKRYEGGFRDLQLPMGHRRTITSLISNHFNNRNAELDDLEASYDADLVRGKGKGLIILLHGAPGVGKTSTAETVADAFGKVLLPITCGDLGLTAEDVESELSEKFHLAELWDCILLLDEADVFLARRTNSDIKRNSLVSVFLRMLEYFSGALFLTTNRVGAFDEAFKSRIHISLYYPPLDAERSWSIWKMNLERLKQKKQRRNEYIEFNENEIFAFAQSHFARTFPRGANWNGRQIRNAFQTASALAEIEAHERNKKARAVSGDGFVPVSPQLRVSHFKEIASVSYDFDNYIAETRGFTEAELAYREGQRMDAYRPSRRPVRASEQPPTRARQSPARAPIPSQRPRPKAQGQPSRFDEPPPRRETKPVNAYGTQPTAPVPWNERPSSMAPSRPKPVQQSTAFASHDRDRQRQAVFDDREPAQYEYDEQEAGYEQQAYEAPTSNAHAHYFEDADQPETSPRRFQTSTEFPTTTTSRRSARAEDYDDYADDFDM